MNCYLRILFVLMCFWVQICRCTRLSLDASGILDINNLQRLNIYNVLSHLDHLSTNTFTLKLSHRDKKHLGIPKNITKLGASFDGFTDVPDAAKVSKNAFGIISPKLSKQMLNLLEAVSHKNLSIPIALKPTDNELNETLLFMDAFRDYWWNIDQVVSMTIEDRGPRKSTDEVKESDGKRTKKEIVFDNKSSPKLFQVSKSNLEVLLKEVFIKPRSHETDILEKVIIKTFLVQKMEEFGLVVMEHDFSAHEPEYLHGREIIGTNVIGILPGKNWNSSADQPIIIGAHYDTVPGTSGAIDNASGTAALLEAARLITSSACQFNHSIIFVAFDLEEIGTHGSFMFVKDILLKLLFPIFGIKSITGAIILDCVANWDPEENSQFVPEAWEKKINGLTEKISKNKNVGDFVAIIHREKPDRILANQIKQYYEELDNKHFRLEMMPLNDLHNIQPNDSVKIENFDFFRSDHYRFWYPSSQLANISFPAVLLSDTGPYRGKMKLCYHAECDNFANIKPNLGFLAKITESVVWATADLAEISCNSKNTSNIDDLFKLAKKEILLGKVLNKRTDNGAGEFESNIGDPPVVTIDDVMEILRYLERIDPTKLDESFDTIKTQVSEFTDSLKNNKTPKNFADQPNIVNGERAESGTIQDFASKLTISIHGKNSTFRIPLKIIHELSTSTQSSQNSNQNFNLNSKISSRTTIRRRFRNPLETDIGTTLQVQ